jgi:dihydrofolate synthase/folylpolyglutamate synthase
MLADKDVTGTVAKVKDQVDRWFVAPSAGARGLAADGLVERMLRAGVQDTAGSDGRRTIERFATVADAYAAAAAAAGPDDRILAFGSFQTVAAVMRARAGTESTSLER